MSSERFFRLNVLPLRLRLAHLAALLRCERDGSARAAEIMAMLDAERVTGGRIG